MRLCISLFLFLSLYAKVNAQQVYSQDNFYKKSAEYVVEKYLADEIEGHKYVLFAIEADIYLILIDKGDFYDEYYINKRQKIFYKKSYKIKKKEKEIIGKVFDKNIYITGLLNYSDIDITLDGNPVYFYFSDSDSKKYGEFVVTVFVKPTPIDEEVYNFAINKMISYIKNEK